MVWQMVCDKVVCEVIVCERWCVQDGGWEMVWQSVRSYCVWKMVCARWWLRDGVWQSCVWSYGVWSYCVTKLFAKLLCVKDDVCKMVVERWSVTKLCVKLWCVKDCVWKMVCARWWLRDGVWQSCVWSYGVWKIMCERWCGVWRRRRRRRRRLGIRNQKQEPHTKLWGIRIVLWTGLRPPFWAHAMLKVFIEHIIPVVGQSNNGFSCAQIPTLISACCRFLFAST